MSQQKLTHFQDMMFFSLEIRLCDFVGHIFTKHICETPDLPQIQVRDDKLDISLHPSSAQAEVS